MLDKDLWEKFFGLKAKEISLTQAEHIEAFAAAYLKLTGISPDKAVLVQQTSEDGKTIRWWFEERRDWTGLESLGG